MRYRQIFITLVTIAVVVGIVFPVAAQETADICIANEIVARIRATGHYDSIEDRATAIDKAIVKVLSQHDTNNPEVNLEQKDDTWTVFCWDIPVIGVYPAEAEANNLSAKELGQIWRRNIRQQLPKATPVSKMEDPFGEANAEENTDETDSEAAETSPDRPETVISQAEDAETAEKQATADAEVPESAALILIIDALRKGRGLNEDQWIDQREQIARNLLNNLRRFIASKPGDTSAPVVAGGSSEIEPSAATAPMTGSETVGAPEKSAAEGQKSEAQETEEAAPAETTETPAEQAEETPETTPEEPEIETSAEEDKYPDDPAYEKVPQKKRIGRKFEAARDPYYELKKTNPEKAEKIDKMLEKARNAFTEKQFDSSEKYVNQALEALGIDPSSIE